MKQRFEENQFEEKAEKLIGFHPEEDLDSKVKFIAHEYIIYLLEKAVPAEENWWLDKNIYCAREELAEFYMQEFLGPDNCFNEMQKYIDFYKEKSSEGTFTPEE